MLLRFSLEKVPHRQPLFTGSTERRDTLADTLAPGPSPKKQQDAQKRRWFLSVCHWRRVCAKQKLCHYLRVVGDPDLRLWPAGEKRKRLELITRSFLGRLELNMAASPNASHISPSKYDWFASKLFPFSCSFGNFREGFCCSPANCLWSCAIVEGELADGVLLLMFAEDKQQWLLCSGRWKQPSSM